MPPPPPTHLPVLAPEVIDLAGTVRRVVDCTLGHGGHAELFLNAGAAAVLGIDRDPEAIAIATERVDDDRLEVLHANYASEPALAAIMDFHPDCILLDLGVSSRQLDDGDRGFTFRRGAPLDMRMDRDGPDAADWLARADEATLAQVFHDWGDERRSRRLAREIVRRRSTQPFRTSDDLVGAIRAVLGPSSGPGDFARIFQAVRIAVNDELGGLDRALPRLRDSLVPDGSLLVISYHSGEDRITKHAFRAWSTGCTCPPELPRCVCGHQPLGEAVPRRAIVASEAEMTLNPRARSARLRRFRRGKASD